MSNNPDPMIFQNAKEDMMENLAALELKVDQAVDQGMVDIDDGYHNELLALMDDAAVVETWPEMAEMISRSQTVETDVDTWLSIHGITTISLEWPVIPE